MSLFDRIRGAGANPGRPEEAEGRGMSRRDFFARVAGRDAPGEPEADPAPTENNGVLQTFLVKGFPYHSGPVLVPILRPGDEYRLAPDPPYSRDPKAVRIERGRDLLGFVPDEHVAEILGLLKEGVPLVCRAVRVEPAAALAEVLTVEIVRPPPPAEDEAVAEQGDDTPETSDAGDGGEGVAGS